MVGGGWSSKVGLSLGVQEGALSHPALKLGRRGAEWGVGQKQLEELKKHMSEPGSLAWPGVWVSLSLSLPLSVVEFGALCL